MVEIQHFIGAFYKISTTVIETISLRPNSKTFNYETKTTFCTSINATVYARSGTCPNP